MKDVTAWNGILKTTTVTYTSASVDESEESKRDDDSLPRRHYDTFVGEPATYHDLPLELRIEIWSWLLVDYEHPAYLWQVQQVVEWPVIYVHPIASTADAGTIYTKRRRDPINKMLRMDAAAKQAVSRRFKPVPTHQLRWHCTGDDIPRNASGRKCDRRRDRCIEWECPVERVSGCHCGIVWVDPANDVFVLPERDRASNFVSTYEQRKSCRLHGAARLEGIDVVQNVLASSEAFMHRTVSGKSVPRLPHNVVLTEDEMDRLKLRKWAWSSNRAALLRLPSLRVVFLLVNDGMWDIYGRHHIVHWETVLLQYLHLCVGKAKNGPRDWLQGMAFADIMTDDSPDKKAWPNHDPLRRERTIEWRLDFQPVKVEQPKELEQPEEVEQPEVEQPAKVEQPVWIEWREKVEPPVKNFADCWAPFAAKGATYQCLLWDENVMRVVYGVP